VINYPCNIHPEGHLHIVGCPTYRVLQEVEKHRAVQVARYGSNDGLKDGTGPGVRWLRPLYFGPATGIEYELRAEYESHGQNPSSAPTSDDITWMHLVREEVAEAFQENDPVRLRDELIQVAALCVSWIEKIDTRAPAVRTDADGYGAEVES
jgi:hypothetical protein